MNPLSKYKLASSVLLTSLLVACSDNTADKQTAPVVQAVKLVQVVERPSFNQRVFPAEVSAVKTIDASFEVTGRLSETNLLTGSTVKKGELLAKIDPTPFERRVKEAEARLAQASRELKRATSTVEKGLSSQSILDNAKTSFELAELSLNNAKQDLGYTQIKAPFDAQISERLVENNSFVKAGDIIARLQDTSRFYFNINVPERMVSGYNKGSLIHAEAEIISSPEKKFELEYLEHSTTPDPITQTYKVVFAASASAHSELVPGSRARVTVKFNSKSVANGLLVPFTTLVSNDNEAFHVWKYQSSNHQVTKVPVTVLNLNAEYALITGELNVGDQLVGAGASKMREALTVKPYQAE